MASIFDPLNERRSIDQIGLGLRISYHIHRGGNIPLANRVKERNLVRPGLKQGMTEKTLISKTVEL